MEPILARAVYSCCTAILTSALFMVPAQAQAADADPNDDTPAVEAEVEAEVETESSSSVDTDAHEFPQKGEISIGGSAGFANAFGHEFDDYEPTITAFIEWHLNEAWSFRALGGFTRMETDIDGATNTAENLWLDVNVLYGWPGDRVKPFVTAGLGIYDQDLSGPSLPGSGDIEPGINAGLGADFGLDNDDWAIKLEFLWHAFDGEEPDNFVTGTVGIAYTF